MNIGGDGTGTGLCSVMIYGADILNLMVLLPEMYVLGQMMMRNNNDNNNICMRQLWKMGRQNIRRHYALHIDVGNIYGKENSFCDNFSSLHYKRTCCRGVRSEYLIKLLIKGFLAQPVCWHVYKRDLYAFLLSLFKQIYPIVYTRNWFK